MNILTNMLPAFAGGLLGFLGLVSALYAVRSLRACRTRCLSLESSLTAVRREMEIVASISLKTGRRLKRIEHQYSGLSDRVDQVELRGTSQCFDQAIDSARRGADPGKLTEQFGLTQGEADLVTRLHGRKKIA